MNKFDIWKKLMHKNAINMLEGVKKILLWRIFERNLAKFFCGAFLSTFWPNCGAFRRKIISHTGNLTSRETKNEEQEIKSDFPIDCQIQIQ